MRSHLCSTRAYRHGHDLVFQANGFVLADLVGVLVRNELHDQEGEQELKQEVKVRSERELEAVEGDALEDAADHRVVPSLSFGTTCEA